MKEVTKMVDVVSITTGEVFQTFDMIWFAEMKRYINGWIKENGYEFVEYDKGTIWVRNKNEKYQMKRECADPFDLMCSDCEVHYIESWEDVTIDELKEDHSYLLVSDKWVQGWEKEEFGWEPTEPDFNKWLKKEVVNGNIKVVA